MPKHHLGRRMMRLWHLQAKSRRRSRSEREGGGITVKPRRKSRPERGGGGDYRKAKEKE